MKKKNLILFFCLFLLTSCVGIVLNLTGMTEKKAKLYTYDFKGKKCVFVYMHHIGKEEFYQDVKKAIDSLRKEGFVVFYEGFKVDKNMDSTKLKEYALKFRKITGITLKPYLDSNRFLGVDVTKWKLVNQPDSYDLGIDSIKDTKTELPINELIDRYERKYSLIHLEKCDLETPLDADYKCNSLKNGFSKYQKIRNIELARQITDSKSNKIAIVFGGYHYYDVRKILDSLKRS